jgi:hypothetical protein
MLVSVWTSEAVVFALNGESARFNEEHLEADPATAVDLSKYCLTKTLGTGHVI